MSNTATRYIDPLSTMERNVMLLRDLVPFLQFKNVKNTHGGVLLLVKLQAVATLLHGCFSLF